VVTLIMTVQCGFWALRAIKILEAEISEIVGQGGFISPRMSDDAAVWVTRARLLYDVGIILLLGGLTLSLVPTGNLLTPRLFAAIVAAIGLVVEVAWVAFTFIRTNRPA